LSRRKEDMSLKSSGSVLSLLRCIDNSTKFDKEPRLQKTRKVLACVSICTFIRVSCFSICTFILHRQLRQLDCVCSPASVFVLLYYYASNLLRWIGISAKLDTEPRLRVLSPASLFVLLYYILSIYILYIIYIYIMSIIYIYTLYIDR
jgi:hypothetical protein